MSEKRETETIKTEEVSKAEGKEGIFEENGVLHVYGHEYILRVAEALSSPTRLNVLLSIYGREMDIGELARLIKQSRANTSTQVKKLEAASLVRAIYRPGQRGVKKLCTSTVREIRLHLQPE